MKTRESLSRRDALKTFTLLGSGLFISPVMCTRSKSPGSTTPVSDTPSLLAIGVNSQGMRVAFRAANYSKIVACCDVDTATFGEFQNRLKAYQDLDPVFYTDYRMALERKDVDGVTIGTPDHWHAKMIIDALESGKDVYVEKPMTLTIAEGIAVCEAARKSDRVIQVGTQQRSVNDGVFLKAIAMAEEGILGEELKATVYLPGGRRRSTEEYPLTDPPASLNWDRWCGPVQKLPYCPERCHGSWRRWVETGHGTLTDWGAHHIDIAQWALGVGNTGPTEITAEGFFPHGQEATLAVITGEKPSASLPNSFSTVRDFQAELKFKNGSILIITDRPKPAAYENHPNGLELAGESGSIFVSRRTRGYNFDGSLGEKIRNDSALQQKIDEKVIQLYHGKIPAYLDDEMPEDLVSSAHEKNFIDCMKDRTEPISDVYTAHRANSSALLAHASMLLGRTLNWDPDGQEFPGDEQANRLLSRAQRDPYKLA